MLSSLLLCPLGIGGRHSFRGADQILCRLKVEEVERGELVPLRRLEHVRRNSLYFACLVVLGVEKVKEELQPAVDDVHFGLSQGFLGRRFVRERGDEEILDGHEDFLPQSRHDGYECGICQCLLHDGKVLVEVGEERLEGVFDVEGGDGGDGGLSLLP